MNSLAQSLYEQLATREHPSGADDRHAHASEAGKCSRAVQYRIIGTPPSNPFQLTTLISFQIGIDLHTQIQGALRRQYPDVQLEVYWERGAVSGHADALYTTPAGVRTVAEIKTASPFAWGYMKEPKREHRLQASVNALALDATMIHIIYLNIAAKAGDDPIREFHELINLAATEAEMDRLTQIATSRLRADREYEGFFINPEAGTFPCNYCGWRDQCTADGR